MVKPDSHSSDRPIFYLIDGHAQFFRAYHAIRTGMTSPVTSEPTNLTFGFVGILLKLMRDYRPDYLAVAVDVSGDRESFRSAIYPEYKANREKAPDDFDPQVERCLQILQEMNIPVYGQEGVEADDVIATIVRRIQREHPDVEVRIVSRDKDLTQLVGEHVQLLDIYKEEVVSPSDIFKVEGVTADQVGDILALMGDTSDNIPGVPGIGPKTAAKLILEYGSIENLLANIEQIKGKRRENLEASRDQIALSRRLVELKDDLDVAFDLEGTRVEPAAIPVAPVLETFQRLGFNQHQDSLRSIAAGGAPATASEAPPPAPDDAIPGGLFDTAPDGPRAPAGPRDPGSYELITTIDGLNRLVAAVRAAGAFAVDTETDSLDAMRANLCGVSVALEPRTGAYIPVRSPEPEAHLTTEQVVDRLRPLLEDESILKIGHNLKYDLNVLRRHGLELKGCLFDTMIASYVVDATRSSHSMNALALGLLEHTCIPISELIGRGKSQRTFDTVPLADACEYAAEDADITLRLHGLFAPQVESMGLQALFDDLEMPLVTVLADMEANGIRVDPEELDRQRRKLAVRIDALRDEISEAAPHPFNPDSPKQLAVALFNKPDQEPPGLGLPVQRRGKTGPSTDQEVLDKLSTDPTIDSPVPDLIVEYRRLTKLVNTYLIALGEAINPETGRVHASFHQTVAATGRLSSSDPNLQNIPIRTDIGREIRRAFVADPGNVLLSADYSQIELRLLAHLADDPALIAAFRRGADIHTAVAAEVYGVEPGDVTPTMRNGAKMVNFGIVYGITPFGLARRLGSGTSVDEAKAIIDDYKKRFGRIDGFLAECVQQARDNGYVETIMGRRRAIPEVNARNGQQRALGERVAINSVVQGSAADLIKLAMIDLHRRLPDAFPDARMVLQIHDELVFEVPENDAAPLRDFVVERMSGAMDLTVDLVVDAAWSNCWIDAK